MKRQVFIIFFTLLFCNIKSQQWVNMIDEPGNNLYKIQQEFNKYWDGKTMEKGKGWKQYKRWEAFMEPRVYPDGIFKSDATAEAYNNYIISIKDKKNTDKSAKLWKPIGPFKVPDNNGGAGRLNCVEFHPANSKLIFVGAPSGGLWRSADAGLSWTTATDKLLSIGITDIAISRQNPDIMYIATGDGDFNDTYSFGVLKSTDAGFTWKSTGLNTTNGFSIQDQKTINRIIIHPLNPNVLMVATTAGIYRTVDAGNTWTLTIKGIFKDIKFKIGNPNIVYATTKNNLYVSEDNGVNFTINTALKLNIISTRLIIGLTKADTNCIYILSGRNDNGGFGGLYCSNDGGLNFEVRSTTPNILGWQTTGEDNGGQAWYDLAIAVSPTNKQNIYVGGINIWNSTDGGVNWNLNTFWQYNYKFPYVHADIHSLKYSNDISPQLFSATDGGLYVTKDNGKIWTDKSNGLSIAQIYRMGLSPNENNTMLTGWQDNGGNMFAGGNWSYIQGGDCMESIISKTDYYYISLYNGLITRIKFGEGPWVEISKTMTTAEKAAWVTPYIIDPTNPDILYAGYFNVWKTTDKGDHWTKISNFKSTNTLNALAISKSNTKYIYTSTGNYIFKTSDGGLNWTNISKGLPNLEITYIAVSPDNPEKVWLTYSGYIAGQKVYYSDNAGSTWKNISGTLPNIPMNCIIYEENTFDFLYLASDIGVYYRNGWSSDWQPLMNGLPNVIVNELEIQYSAKKLRAATYGRGVWEIDLMSVNAVPDILATKQDADMDIYPNPSSSKFNIQINKPFKGTAVLKIYNTLGQVVYSDNNISNPVNLDLHELREGVYYINIISDKDKYIGCIVKQRDY